MTTCCFECQGEAQTPQSAWEGRKRAPMGTGDLEFIGSGAPNRIANFGAFPVEIRPKSGPEGRPTARTAPVSAGN